MEKECPDSPFPHQPQINNRTVSSCKTLDCLSKLGMTVEFILQAGDFQDLSAILIQSRQP